MWTSTAPAVRDLEVFASLPERFRRRGTLTAWARVTRLGEPGDSFLEGPVLDGEGNLFVTDIEYGRVFRVDPGGGWVLIAEYDGEPNGMKLYAPGQLAIADYRNGLLLLDIATGAVSPLLDRHRCERFKGPNDLVFDGAGSLYFTDQGQTGLHDPTGRVHRLGVDGRLDTLLDNVPGPNGLVLSPDERLLYVAATRDNSVWRVPLMTDGGVAKVGRYFTGNGPAGPDGLAMTVDGHLIVALAGRGAVAVLDELADPVLVLRSPTGRLTTNIAVDGRTLYCTESATGTILRGVLDTPGQPLPVPGATPRVSFR